MATDWKLNRGCGAQVNLDRYFASLPPNSVTRFNAFSSMGLRAIDAVFAAAVRGRLDRRLRLRPATAHLPGRRGGDAKPRPVNDRADELADLLAAQRRAGSAGALLWNFVPDPRTDECTLDIGPTDPLFAVLQSLPH